MCIAEMDSGWLTTRNKTKIQSKSTRSKYRTSLVKQKSSPTSNFLLTQNSPPPKQLLTATKQSSLTQFFKPAGSYDDVHEIPYQPEITDERHGKYCSSRLEGSDVSVQGKENDPEDCNVTQAAINPSSTEYIKRLEIGRGKIKSKRKRLSSADNSDINCDVENLRCDKNTAHIKSENYTEHEVSSKRCKTFIKDSRLELLSVVANASKETLCKPSAETEERNSDSLMNDFGAEVSGPWLQHSDKEMLSQTSPELSKYVKVSESSATLPFLYSNSEASESINFSASTDAGSLDLDTEFTLQSQREKYDALERKYHQDQITSDLTIPDVLTPDPLTDDSVCSNLSEGYSHDDRNATSNEHKSQIV